MSVSSARPSEAEIREKTWIGIMRVGRFTGIALLFIAVARYFALQQLQGKSVLDVTTVGTFGLGLLTIVVTQFMPPIPAPFDFNAAPQAKNKKKKIE